MLFRCLHEFPDWLVRLLARLDIDAVGINVVRYITFRTFMALLTALALYLLIGKPMLKWLRRRQCWQAVRDDGPITHLKKEGTPTMGGLVLWLAAAVSCALWANWTNWLVIVCIGVTFGFGLIGFFDDYRKVILRDPRGLRARWKFPLQLAVAAIGMCILYDALQFDRHLAVPFFKTFTPDLGWWAIPFGTVVVVGTSNAVNLTDGLDGLVAGPGIIAFFTFAVLAYLAGHAAIAGYLQIPLISGAGELTVVAGAVVGAIVGFLWFNAHPAEIFMGDVGSLPLGAALGMMAILTKHELLLIVIGGIFVLETVSVIAQVVSFKLTGRRVFRMAPLHHHFELKGWPESKVIVRFWIISFVLALLSLTTLKLR
ncbi:MAG: phospho-N-acetylmuramoyl-pentapeptide-transferase [Deltaproteobacteria bacterium]|nr:phospho-N-acetylmuramoyl-pentapeptide-transferase [Deltaproteobacteria bacterium]